MVKARIAFVVTMLAAGATAADAGDGLPRVWVLPFEQHHPDADLDYLREALPALLTVVLSQSSNYSVVDRHHLDRLLAEQSLTLEGLTSPDARIRAGGLLGATIMVTGSFVRHEGDLRVTIRATDLERGFVTVAAEARGSTARLSELVTELYRHLVGGLGRPLPNLNPDQIDREPLSNLHIMKGLGHYYSARYSLALSEFMLAAETERTSHIPRLWLANSYLAQREFRHAYLELSALARGGWGALADADIAAKMRVCEEYLSPQDVDTIRRLVERREPIRKGNSR